jgi:hypothetical protein
MGIKLMNHLINYFVTAVILAVFGTGQMAFAQGTNKPNVILMLADNLGYGDIRCVWRGRNSRHETVYADWLYQGPW